MDLNVFPSSDPTQSDFIPNRSASTDLLLPSGCGLRRRDLSNSSPSLSCSLIHQDPPLDASILPRAASLPTMELQSSFEAFTPGFCGDPDDETYWFQCSSPGLYQCRVSGLVFDMKGEGDVFYKVVPWNRRFLSQHGKKPAGPLFDISCQQQSVAQLHLPHCEDRSTGRCHFLSVAHLHDEAIEFIRPERITETHIIISITGFSAFGNVKDEDSPPDPVRALVLLFYRPPADLESEHEIKVLMLPKNVVLRHVLHFRKKFDENERFIETPSDCKLQPQQLYTLSTSPGGDAVLVLPKTAEFVWEYNEDYLSSFQVALKTIRGINLSLVEKRTSSCVWKQYIHLLPLKSKMTFFSSGRIKEIQSSTTDRISVTTINPDGAELHSSAVFQTKDGQGQSQPPGLFGVFSLNRFRHRRQKIFAKHRENVEMLQGDLCEVGPTEESRVKLQRSTLPQWPSPKINRYESQWVASTVEGSTDLSTSGRKLKRFSFRKKLLKTLKQTEGPAAAKEQLIKPIDLKQFLDPQNYTPLSLRQPFTTDSSEETSSWCATCWRARSVNQNLSPSSEETSSCLMDLNVSPSSDPTQSDSIPNRSASTDLLLPSGCGLRRRDLSNSSPSLSCSLIHQDPPLDASILPRAASLPTMELQSSFEEFTPGFYGDPDDETYWFQCSSPGLYQCRVSGLVFDMKGGGEVFYRVVLWNRRFLSQHGKKPAGPLFDISCQQQSVAQLHLPHCEDRSTGRCHFLSVAHLHDEGIEFIRPERITETHIIISITGFSAFGNVKDEDSPPDPVRALVLLFYRPPADLESEHEIKVLMLPKNVVLRTVLHFRKLLNDNEIFLERPPDCKLQPNHFYSLSTSPQDDLVLVEPETAEFDAESNDNYFSKFCVSFEKIMKPINLSLMDSSSNIVWKTRVYLSAAGVRRSCGPTRKNHSPKEQLKEISVNLIDRISEPVLKCLVDKLLKETILNASEREAINGEKTREDKTRALVQMVGNKGDDASSKMILFLCELDPYFSKDLGLM